VDFEAFAGGGELGHDVTARGGERRVGEGGVRS
jgi:hypothetical protein